MTERGYFLAVVVVCISLLYACGGGGAGDSSTLVSVPYYLSGSTDDGNDIGVELVVPGASVAQAAEGMYEETISGFLNFDDINLNCSGTLNTQSGFFTVSARGDFGTTELVFTITGILQPSDTPPFSDVELTLLVLINDEISGNYRVDLQYQDTPVSAADNHAIRVDADDLMLDTGYVGTWGMEWNDPYGYQKCICNEASYVYTGYDPTDYDDPYEIQNGTLVRIEQETVMNPNLGDIVVWTWLSYVPDYDDDTHLTSHAYLAGKATVLHNPDDGEDYVFIWFINGNPFDDADAGPGDTSYTTDPVGDDWWGEAQAISDPSHFDPTTDPMTGTFSYFMQRL